jgi:hypothetical protein
MRSAFLFPLSLSLVVAGGCASPVKEQAAARSDLERDITLVSSTRQTAIATPIELGRIRQPAGSQINVSSRHRVVRHRAAPRSTVSSPKPVQVVASTPAPAPAPSVAQPEPMPADPHELPPGKTVTIIPVSTGPSTAGRDPDGFPRPGYGTGGSGMGGGERAGGGSGMGGDCPRPDFGPRTIAGRTRGLLY